MGTRVTLATFQTNPPKPPGNQNRIMTTREVVGEKNTTLAEKKKKGLFQRAAWRHQKKVQKTHFGKRD